MASPLPLLPGPSPWPLETSLNENYALEQLRLLQSFTKGEQESSEDDEELEEAICFLWDAAVLKDIAMFLIDRSAVQCLLTLLHQHRDPPLSKRIIEIALGLLANLLVPESGAGAFSLASLIPFLTSNEPEILIQCLRCLRTLLAHDSQKAEVSSMLVVNSATCLLRVVEIFRNSLDETLIDECVQLISALLDIPNEEILQALFVPARLLESLAEILLCYYRFSKGCSDSLNASIAELAATVSMHSFADAHLFASGNNFLFALLLTVTHDDQFSASEVIVNLYIAAANTLVSLGKKNLKAESAYIWTRLVARFATSFDNASASSCAALLLELLKAYAEVEMDETTRNSFCIKVQHTALDIACRIQLMQQIDDHVMLLLQRLDVFVVGSTSMLSASKRDQFRCIFEEISQTYANRDTNLSDDTWNL